MELPNDPRPDIPGVGGTGSPPGTAQLHLVDADPVPRKSIPPAPMSASR